jgi:protein SMG7
MGQRGRLPAENVRAKPAHPLPNVHTERRVHSLRRQYLRLLLLHPYAKESKDAENYLWMQTSYTFIALYKQRIASLDRLIHAPRTNPHNQQQQQQQSGHGPVEYRKILQRFRQFLAEEDRFWALLVVRLRRAFALDETQPVLATLGIVPATHDLPNNDNPDAPDAQSSVPHSTSNNSHSGRGNSLFPPDELAVCVIPKTPAQRESRLAILSKALVCLGDIARYRELYNESGGRPRAGHEETMSFRKVTRGKRGGQPQEVLVRARNYDRAQLCYEQARLLVPSEGNASHQMAILASYKKDAFGSLVHYYRALCVRQPYDTASENLGTVLSKALEQWRARTRKEKGALKEGETAAELTPPRKVEVFKEKVVVLHALWRLGVEK